MFLFNCTAALCRGSQPSPLASSNAEWQLVKCANASSLPSNKENKTDSHLAHTEAQAASAIYHQSWCERGWIWAPSSVTGAFKCHRMSTEALHPAFLTPMSRNTPSSVYTGMLVFFDELCWSIFSQKRPLQTPGPSNAVCRRLFPGFWCMEGNAATTIPHHTWKGK